MYRFICEVHVRCNEEGWMVSISHTIIVSSDHSLDACSEVEVDKHLVCEPCGPFVAGGYDPYSQEVRRQCYCC